MDVRRLASRDELGELAAGEIAAAMRERLAGGGELRVIFAAAPSQTAMLRVLAVAPDIDWSRVTAFHMDEYIGLDRGAPQGFGHWLREAIFDRVPLKAFHLIDPEEDLEAGCRSYAALLAEAPIDLALLGIGANGHLAFNDPPADLEDPLTVKVVTLDAMCRQQQVEDGCFASLEAVPRQAISLTIPALLGADQLFCCVPGAMKSRAVRDMLQAPVSGDCPATALRLHPRCTVYLDSESARLLER